MYKFRDMSILRFQILHYSTILAPLNTLIFNSTKFIPLNNNFEQMNLKLFLKHS